MSTQNSKTIGIDLGTTNSCIAVMEGGKSKVIPTHEGNNTFPSIVEPVKNLVGAVAKNQMILNAKNTIYSVKRLMGRKMSDPMVKDTMKKVAYEFPTRDLRQNPPKSQGRRRSLPRYQGRLSCYYRPGLL